MEENAQRQMTDEEFKAHMEQVQAKQREEGQKALDRPLKDSILSFLLKDHKLNQQEAEQLLSSVLSSHILPGIAGLADRIAQHRRDSHDTTKPEQRR